MERKKETKNYLVTLWNGIKLIESGFENTLL